jgi:quercetin dioxygenase-like cupin family protein
MAYIAKDTATQRERTLPKRFKSNCIFVATIGILCLSPISVVAQEKPSITHTALLNSELPGSNGKEVIVWDTEYAPGAINPRHLHPSAITFYVISGTGIWQEDGKLPVTLRVGDSLFVPAGTIHSHWNPSSTERLRFLEFIAAEKGKERSVPLPPKN